MSPKPEVGPIIISDVNGKVLSTPTALAAGGSVYLLVNVTHDNQLGADWIVNCSSKLDPGNVPAGTLDTSCGSFSPAHTMSGPVPAYAQTGAGFVTQYTAPAQVPKLGTVTLTAYATSLPVRLSTLTLTIH